MPELGKVSPNRMELLKNKRRQVLAKRGHKLLRDKYDELIRRFLSAMKESVVLRKEAEDSLRQLYSTFVSFEIEATAQELMPLLDRSPLSARLEVESQNLLNRKIPLLKLRTSRKRQHPAPAAPLAFDEFIIQLAKTLRILVKQAQKEHMIRILASEIEKTRRRVNALEYVLLPQLHNNIRFISMKMEELDRETRTRLMKTKEILLESSQS